MNAGEAWLKQVLMKMNVETGASNVRKQFHSFSLPVVYKQPSREQLFWFPFKINTKTSAMEIVYSKFA